MDSNLQRKIISTQIKANFKQPEFKIQNSILSRDMRCIEQVDGDIACCLDLEEECYSFDIQELSAVKYDDPNYMGHEFDESYIYKFPEETQEDAQEDFGPFAGVIEMAVVDYDKFNFALMKF